MDLQQRPDLSQVEAPVKAYIEALEAELEHLKSSSRSSSQAADSPLEPNEPPTTLNVITISQNGLAKRTPRHLYSRQRRGGMGIFDLETAKDNPPVMLTIADESDNLILLTTQARAFKVPVSQIPESPVRGKGQHLTQSVPLENNEHLALVLPHQTSGYLNVISQTGQVRRLRHHFFGDNMTPGNYLYDTKTLGLPSAACWSDGSSDLFIATRQGRAIRFVESAVPFKGCLGIRLSDDDAIAGIAAVKANGGVFLLTADGKGTIRLMDGFSANKAPGAGGKVAIKADNLVAVSTISETDDIFAISRLSKIIRFQAAEVPPKEGVVQGVNCMGLRNDEVTAVAVATLEN